MSINPNSNLGYNNKKILSELTEEENQEIKEAFDFFGSEPTKPIEAKNY